MLAEFPTLDSCVEWLRERPRFVDVLGPTNEGLSPEGDRLLHSVLRPYDDEEKALMRQEQLKPEALAAQATSAVTERLMREQAAERERIANLGPNDPMTVAWVRGKVAFNAEPLDQRLVPDAVAEALDEWIAERNSWVEERGQRVGSAQVTAWPGDVPAGQSRIHYGGQFTVE